jgi:manganese transport protein
LLVRYTEARIKIPHGLFRGVPVIEPANFPRVAVALDFSEADQKALQYALNTGGNTAQYILIHAVESAGALVMGSDIRDYETHSDQKILDQYAETLRQQGYQVEAYIGFGRPKRAIPALVKEKEANLLVMGSHGHDGIKDWIFGATIDVVRHRVNVPVLIV